MIDTSRTFLFALLLVLFTVPRSHADLVDLVVATVDKEAILYSEIMVGLQAEIQNIKRSAISREEADRRTRALILEALEEAIDSKILVREARKYSVEVTDAEVERRVDDLRANFETEEEFINELQVYGESLSDYRERERKKIMGMRLAGSRIRLFEDEVVVSDQAIAQYHQDHKDEFGIPERVLVRQIFLRARQNPAERTKARARLELLLEEIQAGADFAELARVHSQAPGAEEGGIIGWQVKGDLVLPLEEIAFSLANGEVSGVLETLGGVSILKVDEHEPAAVVPLEEVRLDIEELLRAIEATNRYEVWLNDLRKRSRVRKFL